MEIHYIRKLMTSHMVVEQMGELTEWEERMIAHVTVEGVLFGESVRENEKNSLWYDITGKQSLDVVLESGEMGHALLCRILTGIYEAVENIENILLQADGLLLSPECILIDYRTEQVYFCYYPGSIKPVSEAFAELMEYLLTRLDHGDERAVELAYGIYERTSKGDGGLRELKQLLRMPYEQEEPEPGEESQVEMEPDAGAAEYEMRITVANSKTDASAVKPEKNAGTVKPEKNAGAENRRGSETGGPESVWKIGNYLLNRAAGWLKNLPELREFASWKRSLGKKQRTGKKEWAVRGRDMEEETFVFEPEEEEVQQVTRPTVLLTGLAGEPEGILRYEGTGNCGDLVITGTSYVVGSEPGCGGHIPSATVSRRHARITRKENIYFIEDLNSSNGTYVGGELLNYKTKVSLEKNEIVVFANEKFRFI